MSDVKSFAWSIDAILFESFSIISAYFITVYQIPPGKWAIGYYTSLTVFVI